MKTFCALTHDCDLNLKVFKCPKAMYFKSVMVREDAWEPCGFYQVANDLLACPYLHALRAK